MTLKDRTAAILGTDDGTRAWWSFDGASWSAGEMISPDPKWAAGHGSTLLLLSLGYEPTGEFRGTIVRAGSIP